MKQNIIKLLLISSIALFTSCASTTFFTIDVMQPARIDFAENIVNVVIVDNAGATPEPGPTTKPINSMDELTGFSKDIFTKSLAQFLNEEQYFNDVIYYPQVIRDDADYTMQRELSSTQIQAIAKEVDADAVISVNAVDFTAKEMTTNYNNFFYVGAQANLNLILKIYDSNGRPIGPTILAEDSIVWLGDRGASFKNTEFIEQLALEMSEGMAKQLAPHWESQQRWFYSDGTTPMKQAKKQANIGNWEEAAKIWGGAFESVTKEKDKAKIASNIALANENLGDITNAVTWIRIANNLLANHQNSEQFAYTEWYKVALLKREKNNPKVLEQIGVASEEVE